MTPGSHLEDHARLAYDALAPHYDAFTADHDYETWTRDVEALARAAGLRGRRLLDVACGTGKSFVPFLRRGYEVVACDLSPAMLSVAEEKAAGRARLEVHDMRALPRLGDFDLVICLDDAVNYLLTVEELTSALRGMRSNLAPGGVVVFDANCLGTYRGFFASLSVVASEQRVIVWRGATSPALEPGGRARASVQVLLRTGGGAWIEDEQRHLQQHHPEPVIREAVGAAELRLAGTYGMLVDGTIRDGFDELANSKALYVATARGQDHRPGTGTRGT
ncbi:MAG: class I SAM-dependent DNA methyltransferase [Solirubrobacteraceae bacterium]